MPRQRRALKSVKGDSSLATRISRMPRQRRALKSVKGDSSLATNI
jgi:hypothetical protein